LICLPVDVVAYEIEIEGFDGGGIPIRLRESYILKQNVRLEKDGKYYFNPNLFEAVD